MTELYTAVGRFEKRNGGFGKTYPVILVDEKEHIPDIHEMMIWASLNWRVLKRHQLETLYCMKLKDAQVAPHNGFQPHVDRLLRRGLIVKGVGETDADAMYDLFAGLYLVPIESNLVSKIFAFLHLTLFKGIRFRTAANEIFRRPTFTHDEKRVMKLAKQAFLSTSELMACVENGVYDVSTDDKVSDAIYNDEYTTCDSLIFTASAFDCKIPILTAVANLYIRKQILFQKVGAA